MTTIRIKLQTQRINSRSESQFMIAISNKARESYISTRIYIKGEYWDKNKEKVNMKCKNAIRYNRLLQSLLDKALDAWLQLNDENVNASSLPAKEIKAYIEKAIYNREEKKKILTLKDVAEKIKSLRSEAAKSRLNSALKSIEDYESGATNRKITEFTKIWVEKYANWLKCNYHGVSPWVYFTTFKTVFIFAEDNEFIIKNPTKGITVKKVQTKHRVVSVDFVREILVNKNGTWEYDVLGLIFLLIGINFADLHDLTEKSINNGRVEYNRKKTKRLYSILLQPEALNIINKYKSTGNKLGLGLMTGSYRHNYDRLQKIMESIGHGDITTYYMRHTWATIAAEIEIPKETISAALGHSTGSVTDTYISFNARKVDEANRKVIDYVLSCSEKK